MKIEAFEAVEGKAISEIKEQSRFFYSISSSEDLYDIPFIIERDGYYKGNIIKFYDTETKKVYAPFDLVKNIGYTEAIYKDDFFYFLKIDFNTNKVYLIKYYPEKLLEKIYSIPIDKVELYNICIQDADEIYICSYNKKIISYYPKQFTLPLDVNESVEYIDSKKIYITQWIEDEIEKPNGAKDYIYYEKMIVKDFQGNILEEKIGSLKKHTNGKWYIS